MVSCTEARRCCRSLADGSCHTPTLRSSQQIVYATSNQDCLQEPIFLHSYYPNSQCITVMMFFFMERSKERNIRKKCCPQRHKPNSHIHTRGHNTLSNLSVHVLSQKRSKTYKNWNSLHHSNSTTIGCLNYDHNICGLIRKSLIIK